jgi:hypothetical protein
MQKQQFRTSNPSDMHRDSAIDKRKATVKAQVEKDWGIRPQNPVLKPSEAAALNKFRNQVAEQSLDRQHVQKHGGERGMAQKARGAELLQRQNLHGGTK